MTHTVTNVTNLRTSRVRLYVDGETRFRRVMCWCFSNSGTCFVRVNGETLIVRDVTLSEAACAADKPGAS